MKEKAQFITLPALLLLIFFLGKLVMSQAGASYEAGIQYFSMVTLQTHLTLLWPAISRRYKGYGVGGAVQVGIMIALVSQVLILFGTGLSYVAGDTHFNNPIALNQPGPVGFLAAMGIRLVGLIVNCVIAAVTSIIGWFMGGLVPVRDGAEVTE